MYEKFHGLSEAPFSLTPNLRFVYSSRRYAEAEAQLMHAIRNREAVMVVTGDAGTGKTMLCRDVIEKLGRTMTRTAFVANPFLTGAEMMAALLGEFGINVPGQASRKELFDRLNQFLLAQLTLGRQCVAIFDEAQHLPPDFFEQLRVLSNLENDEHKLIQIVLVGQPELLDKLHTPQMAQLDQRVSVRCSLGNLDEAETEAYVRHRLETAKSGASANQVRFSAGALSDVYRSSQGVPRLVNLICDRALLAAFAAQSREVRPRDVQKAVATIRGEDSGAGAGIAPARPRRWPRVAGIAAVVLVIVGAAAAAGYWMQRPGVPADELSYRQALAKPTPAAVEQALGGFIAVHPLSRRYDDALLGLARLEQARGDQNDAIEHLGLLARHAPPGDLRTRAVVMRSYASLGAGDTTGACVKLAADTVVVAVRDTSLARQLESLSSTCAARTDAAVAAVPAVPADTVPTAAVAAAAGARRGTVHGATVPGATVPGATVPGATVHGATVPGATVRGATVTGAAAPAVPVAGDSTKPQSSVKPPAARKRVQRTPAAPRPPVPVDTLLKPS